MNATTRMVGRVWYCCQRKVRFLGRRLCATAADALLPGTRPALLQRTPLEIAEQVRALQDRRFTHKLTQALSTGSQRMVLREERTALVDLPLQAGVVLRDLFDADYGGFTIHPHLKFPHAEALELLVLLARQGHAEMLGMVTYALEQMVEGGLWDKEEGGFFRYSAASDWSMPHTEKMLDEKRGSSRSVLLTAQLSQSEEWYGLARQLIRYINTHLCQSADGVFSGSQSADEEYYEPSNYSRAFSRQSPPIDTTVYTAWNARMISSYLLAARILQQPALETMALRALDWLCEHLVYRDGSIYHFFLNGQAGLPGQLADWCGWLVRCLMPTSCAKNVAILIRRLP